MPSPRGLLSYLLAHDNADSEQDRMTPIQIAATRSAGPAKAGSDSPGRTSARGRVPMTPRADIVARSALLALAAAVSLTAAAAAAATVHGAGARQAGSSPAGTSLQPDEVEPFAVHVPLVMRGAHLPALPAPATAEPTPRESATPSATPYIDPLPPTPTPGPTRDPRRATYPDDADAVVLQIGRTSTDQPGEAWEELNGTPYFTLYGDGRVVASQRLLGWDQKLYETRVDDEQMQRWLVPLNYDYRIFVMKDEYRHPDLPRFDAHVYMRFGEDEAAFKRVTIGGYPRWTRDPLPDVEDAELVRAVAEWMAALETFTTALDEPYAPDEYTVLSMEVRPIGSPVPWSLPIDIAAISDRAPLRTGAGYVHGPPGHLTVDAAAGAPAREQTVVDAARDFPGYNQAAEYSARRRVFAVGVRPEVPGGSLFLPQRLHERLYRKDD